MTNDQSTYDALMLDYAANTASPAVARALEVHMLSSDEGALSGSKWASVADAFREGSDRGQDQKTFAAACDLLSRDLSEVKWKRGIFGAKYARLKNMDGELMRLEPGKSVPKHGHRGLELTVVLEGEFSDGDGVYKRGDVVIGRPGIRHKPAAHGDDACICFVVKTPYG